MAIIERPSVTTTPAVIAPATPSSSLGTLRRPVTTGGWKAWLFTVDHKKLGIMYMATALFFFIVGGLEAVLIRLQLAAPNGKVLNADLYNQMFTMHATTMVFLFVMPMAAGLANYFIPLQIGARDVAFPRINAFSFWALLFGGIFINLSWFLGGAADGGWFMYAPNSGPVFSPSHGIDFWALGLQITGISSLAGAVNLITTVLNMRAPGMKLMRMPVFTWLQLVVQFLLLFAVPVITVALFLLSFQRNFGATFFDVAAGADPLLWQHLFWIFGHPEVYILILPSFGIISEVLPVFARKPLFGYPFVVFSGAAIGFVGWGVWAHHMFASGLGPVSVAVFSIATMAIAVPTGVKIVNWTLTLWGGKLVYTAAMKFAIGLIVLFTIGGLSGVTHSVAPSDTQQTDTYYIVAHFHYVLFGGAIFGLFSGFYYWWPKVFGKLLKGFFNLGFWNLIASIGSLVLTFGILLFLINVVVTTRKGQVAPLDPWNARSLEWMTSNPPKEHNFDSIPTVHHLDEFFHRKYQEDANGVMQQVKTAEEVLKELEDNADAHIHMPSPSYWPIVLALGMPVLAFGVIYSIPVAIFGAVVILFGAYGWAIEPSTAPDDDIDPPTESGTSMGVAHVS
ncbi:MAG: cbb3-type cytochrome c oxidase subunit I [Actinobacteria bacterium]|nr:cbb3-type cytochrome c oxidase subunit I [Actinomycetota bacterium]